MRLFLTLSFLFISACSQFTAVPVTLHLDAGAHLNAKKNESSLPVRVVVYQLSSAQAFKEATFRQLWKQDKAALGDSLLSRREMTVTPNTREKIKLTRHSDAQYLAVVALFRQPGFSHWRAIKPLPNQAVNLISSMLLVLEGERVELK